MNASSGDDDDDDQLRLAIALSLQDQAGEGQNHGSESKKTFIDLLSDDDDTPARAIPSAQSTSTKSQGGATNTHSSVGPLGILGLDRKAMEEERLARARKRKISVSPPPLSRAAKVTKMADLMPKESQAKQATASKPGSKPAKAMQQPFSSSIQYPNGVVKKTWSYGFPRENDIKLEEVLQRSSLQLAVLSSFQWDIEWLFSKLDMARSKIVFVMQAKDEAIKRQYARETADLTNLRLCFPSMAGNVNCMHSKLMLLSHPTHLRIVVPTANLVPYDWGEPGILENSVFLIDLPRLSENTSEQQEDHLTFFGKELLRFCRAMGLSSDICNSLLKFDFSGTKPFAFVHTIGGEHSGADEPWRCTGYPGLGLAVKRLGLKTSADVEIDFIASSLGSLNMEFLSTLYLAAQGDDGNTEFEWRTKPKPRGKKAQAPSLDNIRQAAVHKSIEQNMRLFFPSRDTVLGSKGGVNAAGPICFQKRWWEGAKFPRKVLRDCKSTRDGLLMHNKILYVRPRIDSGEPNAASPASDATTVTMEDDNKPSNVSGEQRLRSWAYIGSANCSESAWGRLVVDRTKKITKLGCRNWECGVVVPIEADKLEKLKKEDGALPEGLKVFEGTIPVPIVWPGEPMEEKTPWFYSVEDDP